MQVNCLMVIVTTGLSSNVNCTASVDNEACPQCATLHIRLTCTTTGGIRDLIVHAGLTQLCIRAVVLTWECSISTTTQRCLDHFLQRSHGLSGCHVPSSGSYEMCQEHFPLHRGLGRPGCQGKIPRCQRTPGSGKDLQAMLTA